MPKKNTKKVKTPNIEEIEQQVENAAMKGLPEAAEIKCNILGAIEHLFGIIDNIFANKEDVDHDEYLLYYMDKVADVMWYTIKQTSWIPWVKSVEEKISFFRTVTLLVMLYKYKYLKESKIIEPVIKGEQEIDSDYLKNWKDDPLDS